MKVKSKVVVLKPVSGQREITKQFELNGYVESVVAYSRGREKILQPLEAVSPLVFLSLTDNTGSEIVPKVLIENFEQRGGAYKDSFKPMDFNSRNETFSLTLSTERQSDGTQANDIEVFVYFNYGDEPIKKIETIRPIAQPVRSTQPPARR